MIINRALRFAQGRTFVSSLFGFTFFATVLTVSASNILPCPARPNKNRFADSDSDKHEAMSYQGGDVLVSSKRRRWIEEVHPVVEKES
ncbi:hypothetical protein K435DRAFT_747862 [Dendrothele bispora CBS 962.96]|uniref:Uncharacterized protein n=1 Tax=Dendrothele bispora (strain CBS 962.96) TaxID=1314807 RepID=A0A4S8MKC5_DENBC|nr:hypothetical protein K435DRAFT_747862 [Dendrothele bispora CBS 962.96]